MKDCMDNLKGLIGKQLFFEGTGNAARLANRIRTGGIIKVARVFVTVQFDGSAHQYKFRVSRNNNMHLVGEFNNGWNIYQSEQDIKDTHEEQRLAGRICQQYRYPSSYLVLGLSTIRKVAELLGVKD